MKRRKSYQCPHLNLDALEYVKSMTSFELYSDKDTYDRYYSCFDCCSGIFHKIEWLDYNE